MIYQAEDIILKQIYLGLLFCSVSFTMLQQSIFNFPQSNVKELVKKPNVKATTPGKYCSTYTQILVWENL